MKRSIPVQGRAHYGIDALYIVAALLLSSILYLVLEKVTQPRKGSQS